MIEEETNIILPGKRIYGSAVGICMMDRTFPRPVGDMGNMRSFSVPVMYDIVHGVAGMPAMSVTQTNDLYTPFYESCMRLVDQGASAITTTCGYAALLQDRLAASVPVTFAASSLIQIPSVFAALPSSAKIAVIAARAPGLTRDHLLNTGVSADQWERIVIVDLQQAPAFKEAILDNPGKVPLDVNRARQDISRLCAEAVQVDPAIGAFVAECANVGPYSRAIQAATDRPVWDGVTLVHWLHAARNGT